LKFAADDQLLLVAPGKSAGGQEWIWRPHVKVPNDLNGAPLNPFLIKENRANSSDGRLAIVNAQNRVLSQSEIQQQPAAVTVFRHVSNAQLFPFASVQPRNVSALESDRSGEVGTRNQTGERFD